MKTFAVTQDLFGLEARYEVRREGDEAPWRTLRGTEAVMELRSGDGEELYASFRMKSILTDTRFEAYDAEGNPIARFEFPLVELKKRFRLHVGGRTLEGEGGLRGRTFRFRDAEGAEVLVIRKSASFRDRYTVEVDVSVPIDVALLATAVVDQRHFEHRA